MTEIALTDTPVGLPAGRRKTEVLARLREADGPLTVHEIAQRTGLHINTARFHLDGLVADGVAERTVESRAHPGRPRILYAARSEATGPRSFGLLAEMLTGLVAGLDDFSGRAVAAGRAWGRHLVERPSPSERVSAAEATARLTKVLDAIGFQPTTRSPDPRSAGAEAGVTEVNLHHCPFLEVAERHTDVVCAIHRGLLDGALEELGAPMTTESLEPFVTPNLCVARLRHTNHPNGSADGNPSRPRRRATA